MGRCSWLGPACPIFGHFLNVDSGYYKSIELDRRTQRQLVAYLEPICSAEEGSDGSDYNPKDKAFNAAFDVTRGAIEDSNPAILPLFFGSDLFKQCAGGRTQVKRDLGNFKRLAFEYCESEANGAGQRISTGGRPRLETALLSSWVDICSDDPEFWPKGLSEPRNSRGAPPS